MFTRVSMLKKLWLNTLSISQILDILHVRLNRGDKFDKLVDRLARARTPRAGRKAEHIDYRLVRAYRKCIIIFSPVCERM